jgi:hypothetical protein
MYPRSPNLGPSFHRAGRIVPSIPPRPDLPQSRPDTAYSIQCATPALTAIEQAGQPGTSTSSEQASVYFLPYTRFG